MPALPQFYSKFITLVHENVALTPKQKLYLLSHVKGTVCEKISTLPVNDNSYDIGVHAHGPIPQQKAGSPNLLPESSTASYHPIEVFEVIHNFVDSITSNFRQSLKVEDIFQDVSCQN